MLCVLYICVYVFMRSYFLFTCAINYVSHSENIAASAVCLRPLDFLLALPVSVIRSYWKSVLWIIRWLADIEISLAALSVRFLDICSKRGLWKFRFEASTASAVSTTTSHSFVGESLHMNVITRRSRKSYDEFKNDVVPTF